MKKIKNLKEFVNKAVEICQKKIQEFKKEKK